MGWIKTYDNWQAVIAEHYGDLAKFGDAQTVRIMLRDASREEASLEELLVKLKEALPPDDPWIPNTQEELKRVVAAKDELRKWLTDRGLEP